MKDFLYLLVLILLLCGVLAVIRWSLAGGRLKFAPKVCPTVSVPEGWRARLGMDGAGITLAGGSGGMAPIVMVLLLQHDDAVTMELLLSRLLPPDEESGENDSPVREPVELQSGLQGVRVRRKVTFESDEKERTECIGAIPTGVPGQFVWIQANSSDEDWAETELAFKRVLDSVRLDGELYPRAPRTYCLLEPEKARISGIIEGQQLHAIEMFEVVLANEIPKWEGRNKTAVVEMLVSEGLPSLAAIYRLKRFDVALIEKTSEGKSPSVEEIELRDNRVQDFEPILFRFQEKLEVELSPFHWGAIEFAIEGEVTDWCPFEIWAEKWLDIEDAKALQLGDADLAGVVHWLHPRERRETSWWITIDFGSASTDAFWEILLACSDMGVRRVRVGSWATAESGSAPDSKAVSNQGR